MAFFTFPESSQHRRPALPGISPILLTLSLPAPWLITAFGVTVIGIARSS